MAGMRRFIEIVRLFDEERPAWTISDMAAELDAPVSTIYRTVRDLCGADCLEALPGAHYVLGAAFVEFDRRFRLTDPLAKVGSKFLQSLVKQAPVPCTVLLARLYSDEVMCIHSETSEEIRFSTSYERGKPMPLVRGATSKAILGHLKRRQLEKLLCTKAQDMPSAAQAELITELGNVRKRGYSVARGEVDKGLMGMAAPINNAKLGVNASLSFICEAAALDSARETWILPLLLSTAQVITNEIAELAESRKDVAEA